MNKPLLYTLLGIGTIAATRAIQRRRRRMSFAGKTIVITGGARGLGLVVARMLAKEGANLAICSRTQHQLDAAEAELRTYGVAVHAYRCDLTDTTQLNAFFADVQLLLGPVDVLINCAGIILAGPYANTTEADFQDAMTSNFWVAYHACNAVLPDMQRRRAGRIVNVASIGGKVSVPHLLPYSTSKFALVGYSEGLRAEVARDNVFVTTICPGLIRTGSPRQALVRGQHEKEYAWFKIADSLPGLAASAEAVASQLIEAARYGEAERIITLPAKLATYLHGLFPGLVADASAAINTLLPNPAEGQNTPLRVGRDLETPVTQSVLTVLTDEAAAKNNEY
jgi:short-subunit dehydrogenase